MTNDHDPLGQLAESYRRDGYEVFVRPTKENLPLFLSGSEVALLAVKGNEYLAFHPFQAEQYQPPQPFSVAREPETAYLRDLLLEAEELVRSGKVEASLLLAWSVTEAGLRKVARSEGVEERHRLPHDLVRLLHQKGTLNLEERNTLEDCWNRRNLVSHGLRPDVISPSQISSLIAIAQRLIAAAPEESDAVSDQLTVHYGYGIRESRELFPLAKQAKWALLDVMGSMSDPVSAEWDCSENAKWQPVVTLRLADEWGAVTGTFDPTELTFPPTLKSRLNKLWGNLLKVRGRELLKVIELVGSAEES